jgi:hypothetical protein
LAEKDMDCDECEDLIIHRNKNPNCEKCLSVSLLPGNELAYGVYTTIRSFGPVTFEAVDRAMIRLGVDDESIIGKISILNKEYETTKSLKRKEEREKQRGSKRR